MRDHRIRQGAFQTELNDIMLRRVPQLSYDSRKALMWGICAGQPRTCASLMALVVTIFSVGGSAQRASLFF